MTAALQQVELFPGHGSWDAVSKWEKSYLERLRFRGEGVTLESRFKDTTIAIPGSDQAWKTVILWGGVGWSSAWFDNADRAIRWLPPSARFAHDDRIIVAIKTDGQRQRLYSITVCDWCLQAFLASRKDAIFCGPTCRKQHNRNGGSCA